MDCKYCNRSFKSLQAVRAHLKGCPGKPRTEQPVVNITKGQKEAMPRQCLGNAYAMPGNSPRREAYNKPDDYIKQIQAGVIRDFFRDMRAGDEQRESARRESELKRMSSLLERLELALAERGKSPSGDVPSVKSPMAQLVEQVSVFRDIGRMDKMSLQELADLDERIRRLGL